MRYQSSTPFPHSHRAGVLYNIQYFSKWQKGEALVEKRRLDWINKVYNFMGQYVNYKNLDIGRNVNWTCLESKVWGEKYFKGNYEE